MTTTPNTQTDLAEALKAADKLERVAAQLSVERIQGWVNPLVCDIMDAVRLLRKETPVPDTGEAVLSAALTVPAHPEGVRERVAAKIATALQAAEECRRELGPDWDVPVSPATLAEIAIDAILNQLPESGWRDIESAPIDWQSVLLFCPNDARNNPICEGYYAPKLYEGDDTWRSSDGDAVSPTHWKPLPPPPLETANNKGGGSDA